VGVIDKSVVVLGALEARPLTLNELVDATSFSRATTHRLAVALEAHGLVRRDADGRFALGVRLIALGRAAAEAIPLAAAAEPALAALRDATGESAQLYVQDGDRRVCIASLESPHGLRTIVPMGASFPLDVGGSAGKLLLAAADGRPLKPWVQSVGEREAGVASVSAPVCDDAGTIVAAVSVSGPIERTTRQPGKRYADDVEAAARRIERDAGLR
jgi:DNA-binding IclR family transcriptional regulator